MFRLVLIHQLVLSLLVGPMLCCCAATRLGHETHTSSRTASHRAKPERKHCCGERKSDDSGHRAPGGKPSDPAKCPCKDAPVKAVALPEAPQAPADTVAQPGSTVATLDLPIDSVGPLGAHPSARPLGCRSSSLSAADILFAHHNLRC
jgi:hypothetical protein